MRGYRLAATGLGVVASSPITASSRGRTSDLFIVCVAVWLGKSDVLGEGLFDGNARMAPCSRATRSRSSPCCRSIPQNVSYQGLKRAYNRDPICRAGHRQFADRRAKRYVGIRQKSWPLSGGRESLRAKGAAGRDGLAGPATADLLSVTSLRPAMNLYLESTRGLTVGRPPDARPRPSSGRSRQPTRLIYVHRRTSIATNRVADVLQGGDHNLINASVPDSWTQSERTCPNLVATKPDPAYRY